ncbi:hypothetical protein P1X15_32465 [Runella sp. MFBS21]|uniref:hypothetical protein n=1 Tax=Runella sp. MFBS21 TaxID=3034018 RepID=UPI0023F87144|nr:hypothetical protein [Runella sp. MFBS21]MDF7822367.1 hypothetical protein [Runella sp. MFBS21]
MINFHNLDNCPLPQLHEMLAEARNAQKFFEENPDAKVKTITSYHVNDQQILCLEGGEFQDENIALELYYIAEGIQQTIDEKQASKA